MNSWERFCAAIGQTFVIVVLAIVVLAIVAAPFVAAYLYGRSSCSAPTPVATPTTTASPDCAGKICVVIVEKPSPAPQKGSAPVTARPTPPSQPAPACPPCQSLLDSAAKAAGTPTSSNEEWSDDAPARAALSDEEEATLILQRANAAARQNH